MGSVFTDTSGFYALSTREHGRHLQAISALAAASRLMTTRFVVVETVSLITKRRSPLEARLWYEKLAASEAVEIREFDAALYRKTERFWQRHHDKEWDLVDCYSFCLMREEGITDALTFDAHFRQAGFNFAPRNDE